MPSIGANYSLVTLQACKRPIRKNVATSSSRPVVTLCIRRYFMCVGIPPFMSSSAVTNPVQYMPADNLADLNHETIASKQVRTT